jgi:hypothetical protein
MLDAATLRTLIREVISEEVAAVKAARAGAGPPAAPAAPPHPAPAPAPSPSPGTVATPGPALPEQRVRIAGDADLAAFARQVLQLASDPTKRRAIEAGRYPFRLQAAPGGAARAASGPSVRIAEGVVTETMIGKLAAGTARLELAPGVAVTPLARDAARRLGIAIERSSQ